MSFHSICMKLSNDVNNVWNSLFFTIHIKSWVWWCMPSIPELGRQRQKDLCEFQAILVFIMSSRPVRVTQQSPVSKKKKEITAAKNPKSHLKFEVILSSPPPFHRWCMCMDTYVRGDQRSTCCSFLYCLLLNKQTPGSLTEIGAHLTHLD